jgi:hypothetical protein
MKKIYLLVVILYSQFAFSQQNSIMQPAIKNSDQKLDSVYIQSYDAIRRSSDIPYPTEKWFARRYDSDKNPIEFMVYHYGNAPQITPIDSTRVTLEHFAYNAYTSDFRNQIINYDYGYLNESRNKVYMLFNIKSATEEIYNHNTNNWILKSYMSFLSDNRLAGANFVSRISMGYDANYNVINASKNEGTIELNGLGYMSDKTYYTWDVSTGFSPNIKYKFYNTYDANDKLLESIVTKIVDFTTNTEVNNRKETYNYSSNLFEYTTQFWDATTNSWNIPTQKVSTTYDANNNPIDKTYYKWESGNWVNDDAVLSHSVTFSNNLFASRSASSPANGEDFGYSYDSNNLLTFETYSFLEGYDANGIYESKEFYYSSDVGMSVDDFNLSRLSIYPNPTNDKVFVNLNTDFNYNIYSIQGKLLKKGATNQFIDVSHFTAGIYVIQFKVENKLISKKLIIN